MVRLVFRPYTQFDDRFARQNRDGLHHRSPGFALPRHSYTIFRVPARALCRPLGRRNGSALLSRCAHGLATRTLARPLDSLVRVSRRVSRRGRWSRGRRAVSQAATARGCRSSRSVSPARPQPRAAAVCFPFNNFTHF